MTKLKPGRIKVTCQKLHVWKTRIDNQIQVDYLDLNAKPVSAQRTDWGYAEMWIFIFPLLLSSVK